jgi:proteasome beta subunit
MNNNNTKEAGEISEEKNGTTTVGIKTKDGVVVATDRKVSYFMSTAKKDMNKIMPIHDTAVMTMAGVVGHAQKVRDKLQGKVTTYESRRGRKMPIESIPYVLRNMFEEDHYHIGPILAGVDNTGNYLYEVEPNGAIISYKEYTSTGSGVQFATGVLEQGYHDDITLEEAQELALNAIKTASERDNFTGDGLVIATITEDGVDTNLYDSIPDKL